MEQYTETVDVIIPVRNRPRLIEICLDSVKEQTLQPNSVIAVDDGSTDSTPAVLAEYARRWSKLRVLRSNHLGTARARNIGLAASQAEFVAFLDSDDIWLPEKLEQQMPLFAGRPNVGLVHCACFQISDEGEILHEGRVFAPSKRGDVFEEMINKFYHLSGSASGIVARRDLVMRVGGFDESLLHVEDQDLWLKLACVSLVDFTPEPLVALRSHDGNRFSGRAKSDPALALLQKIAVWSKWIELADKEAAVENLRRDAFVINQASPLRFFFHFRAYRKLKTSMLPLARLLFPTFASYLRRLFAVHGVSSFVTPSVHESSAIAFDGAGRGAGPGHCKSAIHPRVWP
jgi:glycosyltransferase involved in cell wall biosynthesis